jgi:hypothetical protein
MFPHDETLDEGENPAWDFLVKACALFAPISVEDDSMSWKCPFCNVPNPDMWNPLCAIHDNKGKPLSEPRKQISNFIKTAVFMGELGEAVTAQLFWTVCRNDECREIVVMVRHGHHAATRPPSLADLDLWFAIPKKRNPRPIADAVPEPYRTDYIEAASILEDSPRMSAVLSRRILTDLLAEYGHLKGYKLSKQTEKVAADATYPTRLRENVEHFREIADFGAHTQKDETGAIIPVTLEEAEWTLELLDGFFDYYILAQEQNKKRRVEFDKKIEAAGRKPIGKS